MYTFVFRFVVVVVFLKGSVLFDFLCNRSGILAQLNGDTSKGKLCVQSFFNGNTVIHGHVFLITRYGFTHKYLFLLRMGGTSIIKDNRMECKTKFSIDVEFSFSFKENEIIFQATLMDTEIVILGEINQRNTNIAY